MSSSSSFANTISLTELWIKTAESATRNYTINAVKALAEKYNFPADEAVQFLGLEATNVVKKPMAKRTKKEEAPAPAPAPAPAAAHS